jgi:hypothetical protein
VKRVLVVRGVELSISGWAEESGLAASTIRARLKRGWPAEAAVSKEPKLVAIQLVVAR